MKIRKIYIRNLDQFQNTDFDFTNSETGEVLKKICFIGSNGTGKSKLLNVIILLLNNILKDIGSTLIFPILSNNTNSKVLYELENDDQIFLIYYMNRRVTIFLGDNSFAPDDTFVNAILGVIDQNDFTKMRWREYTQGSLHPSFLSTIKSKSNSKDLVIYAPAESNINGYNTIGDVPETNVNEALKLAKDYPFYSEVSSDKVKIFWRLLVYNLRRRAEEREKFENLPANLQKTKKELIEEFDNLYPKVLVQLSSLWNKILDKAGLYFDADGASNPYQLTDNLKAYIKLKSTNQIVKYSQLSTGIRNYIFRVGHIFSLYFDRNIDNAFLLVDEPENSLFPDFLFDLMDIYNEIVLDKRRQNNTQIFFSTHNPIIAAQFKPHERIILTWNIDGNVSVNRGITPEGDDPNDILVKDFGLHQLMGPVGISYWEKYLGLQKDLRKAKTFDEKKNLAAEINRIGTLYNFPAL